MFKFALTSLLLLWCSASFAFGPGVVGAPECNNMNGEKVSYHPVSRKYLNVRGVALGIALHDQQGNPLIGIDREGFSLLTKETQTFILYHECGHHSLGHIITREDINVAEPDADCYAMRKLIELGFSNEQLLTVMDEMGDTHTMQQFTSNPWYAFSTFSLNSQKIMLNQRKARMKQCIGWKE